MKVIIVKGSGVWKDDKILNLYGKGVIILKQKDVVNEDKQIISEILEIIREGIFYECIFMVNFRR